MRAEWSYVVGGGDEAVVVWMGVMEAARGYINVRSFDTIFFFFIFESLRYYATQYRSGVNRGILSDGNNFLLYWGLWN